MQIWEEREPVEEQVCRLRHSPQRTQRAQRKTFRVCATLCRDIFEAQSQLKPGPGLTGPPCASRMVP
jgi:hypothetical protein